MVLIMNAIYTYNSFKLEYVKYLKGLGLKANDPDTYSIHGRYDAQVGRFVNSVEVGREKEGLDALEALKERTSPANAYKELPLTLFNDFTERQNHQLLVLVQNMYNYLGYENVPKTYGELTATDIAIAGFRSIMFSDLGCSGIDSVDSAGNSFTYGEDYFDLMKKTNLVGLHGAHTVDEDLPFTLAQIAAEQVWRDCFFSDKNIENIVNNPFMFGTSFDEAEIDRDFLYKAIKDYQRIENEIFDARLENSFEFLAQDETEVIYGMFDASYNMDACESDPNFQAFKTAYRDLIEVMYNKAVQLFYSGYNGDILKLSEGTYVEGRKFNVNGTLYTKQELDEARRLILRGEYFTQTPEANEKVEETGVPQTKHSESDKLSDMFFSQYTKRYYADFDDILFSMLDRRNRGNRKMNDTLSKYEEHILSQKKMMRNINMEV